MSKKLHDTVSVEHVTAAQFGACFGAKFTSIANSAEFIFISALEVSFGFCTV